MTFLMILFALIRWFGELGKVLGILRDVRQGPDGFIYLLTDAPNGVLARVEPAE